MPPLQSLVAGRLAAAFCSPCTDHSIAGRSLHPFCAAHSLTLRAIDNPIPWDIAKASPAQLVQAARVCECGSWSEIYGINWRKPTKGDNAALALIAKGRADDIRKAWLLYRQDSVVMPELVEPEKRGKGSTVPFLLGAVVVVAKAFGQHPDWAWFLRYSQLSHYACAINEGEFGCRWVTEAEEIQYAELAARGIFGTKPASEGMKRVKRVKGGSRG